MRWLLLVVFVCSPALWAKDASPQVNDPQLEERVMSVAQDLRCLVCQNESLADSHADLAYDLRREIREKMQVGMSDQEIVNFMVQRYGDFIRFKPAIKASTLALWIGPFALLLASLMTAWFYIRSRNRKIAVTQLTQDEARQLNAFLDANQRQETK